MVKQHCLFSAPYAFIPGLEKEYNRFVPTEFCEIWKGEDVPVSEKYTVWIMNPGQNFIIGEETLDKLPNVKLLITPSTGRNHINMVECDARGIAVYSLLDDRPGLDLITASAEFTFLLLLNTLRRLDFAIGEVTEGRWRDREDMLRGHELSGKKVGLVGLGRIGSKLARFIQAFDAKAVYYDPYVSNREVERCATIEELFDQCDAVCVCCTLTDETRGMIDGSLIAKLKNGASLVNTSRGEVVCEDELHSVLLERSDLRVGLDVLENEVIGTHLESRLCELHRSRQIVISPHIAGACVESQAKAATIALKLLQRHIGVA